MENMTSAQLAQLLYVAYYGRPADPAGLEFWSAQIDEVGVQGIAADFGTSAEFDARFGDLGSVALINNLYQQLFGRDAEAEGLQYWLDVLSEGTPLASIALEIANGAQGGDATGLQNKVTLAAQFTTAVAAGSVAYEGEAAANYGRDFLATINENTNVENYDVQAVVDAIESGELPVDTADLRAALEELRVAEEAEADFLVNALDNEAVAAIVADPEAETATRADIEAAVDATRDALAVELGELETDFEAAGANTKAGLIADARAEREEAIVDAQDDLDEAATAINQITGLRTALNNYENAVAAQVTAQAVFDDAQADASGAQTAFSGRNEAPVIDYLDDEGTGNADREAAFEVTVDGNVVLRFNEETNQYDVVNDDGTNTAELSGFDAFRTAIQAERDAAIALETAGERVTTTGDAVNAILTNEDNADAIDEIAADADIELVAGDFANAAALASAFEDLRTAVTDAETDLSDLNDAVAAWEATVSLEAELTSLEEAVTAARDFIEDDLGFDLRDFLAEETADQGNDVYLFADSTDAAITIGSFGDEGVDRIFFGPDYKPVQLAEGETIESRVGSASELEIFWSQGDTGLQLFVEAGAEAGRDLNDDNISTITLTGVNAEDISFTSGFLSAGTATEVA